MPGEVVRPVSAAQLAAAQGGLSDALFTVGWAPLPEAAEVPATGALAAVGTGAGFLAAAFATASRAVRAHGSLVQLAAAVAAGGRSR